jgi:hypothetical protein
MGGSLCRKYLQSIAIKYRMTNGRPASPRQARLVHVIPYSKNGKEIFRNAIQWLRKLVYSGGLAMKRQYSQLVTRVVGAFLVLCSVGGAPAYAMPIAVAQQAFADQLSMGQFFYPVVESGPDAGKVAVFQDPGTAFATHDGFWRSLLKGAAVVAGGVAGSAAGPGGTAVGALATATVVNDINRQGPGPGRRWLISDARIYREVEVAGVGNILPGVLSAAESNIVSSFNLSPTHTLSFVDPSVIGVRAKDAGGTPVSTVDFAQAFVLTSTETGISQSLFGTVVLNTVGAPGDRPLNSTDFLDVDVGSLLTAPDGTPVTVQSTLVVGFSTPVPEPAATSLFGVGLIVLLAYQFSGYRRHHYAA